jgi:hypothetical protein
MVAQLFSHLAYSANSSLSAGLERIVIGKLGNLDLFLMDLIKRIVKDCALYAHFNGLLHAAEASQTFGVGVEKA